MTVLLLLTFHRNKLVKTPSQANVTADKFANAFQPGQQWNSRQGCSSKPDESR